MSSQKWIVPFWSTRVWGANVTPSSSSPEMMALPAEITSSQSTGPRDERSVGWQRKVWVGVSRPMYTVLPEKMRHYICPFREIASLSTLEISSQTRLEVLKIKVVIRKWVQQINAKLQYSITNWYSEAEIAGSGYPRSVGSQQVRRQKELASFSIHTDT